MPYSEIKNSALTELKRLMSPELLNRIDDTIVVNALSEEEVAAILDIRLAELAARLSYPLYTVIFTACLWIF